VIPAIQIPVSAAAATADLIPSLNQMATPMKFHSQLIKNTLQEQVKLQCGDFNRISWEAA
jgi:hypothetical protein